MPPMTIIVASNGPSARLKGWVTARDETNTYQIQPTA
jgi:hypothetical protein